MQLTKRFDAVPLTRDYMVNEKTQVHRLGRLRKLR
jgi:hypothetical protein